TRGTIRFAIKDLLEARKSYPDIYSEDKIMLMAINVAAMEEPEAPVSEVYQEVKHALLRAMAEGTPSPALRATSPRGGGSGAEHGEE
ncbi:MAG: hypothetical protein MJ074_10335, partial [Oscillospiraceae bacterium]|nr:hypothetical protein [Oscillospiraceae bacterium]